MERRRLTRGFSWVIFSLQVLDFSQDEEADAEVGSGQLWQCSPASGFWEQCPQGSCAPPKTPAQSPRSRKTPQEAAGRVSVGFAHHQFYPSLLF